ncbi:hypothetical protein BJX65DRAFT_10026 [Aspergillus insuetus]
MLRVHRVMFRLNAMTILASYLSKLASAQALTNDSFFTIYPGPCHLPNCILSLDPANQVLMLCSSVGSCSPAAIYFHCTRGRTNNRRILL